jgi:hypothetical protein
VKIGKHDLKVAVHPVTGEVLSGFCQHASWLSVDFDKWIRAIIFPSRKRVYFRFYKPSGDYSFVTDEERAASFNACYSAREILIKKGYARRSWKVLYYETDKVITPLDIRY